MADNDMKTNEPIKGRVASILNERELVINIGIQHGVQKQMKFQVLAAEPIEVTDPQTREKLGTIDREKVRVAVTEVQDKFSICKTYRKFAASPLGLLGAAFVTYGEKYETLKVGEPHPLPLSEEASYVKIGDRVIQLLDEADQ